MLYWISRFFVMIFYRLFYPQKVFGKENLPKTKDEPLMIVSNHYGKIDVLAVSTLYREKVFLLGKKEWFENKLFAFFCTKYGGIPIDRDKVDFDSMKRCFAVLKANKKLVVYPEGTRNKSGNDLLPIKGGAALIAFKGKCKVLPISMEKKFRIFHRNYMNIGKPFDFSEFYGQKMDNELMDKMIAKMYDKMTECHDEIKALKAARKKNK